MCSRWFSACVLGSIVCWSFAATAEAVVLTDDFTGGLNLPWVFLDDLGNSPPDFTSVTFDDPDQDLKFIGSADDYDENLDLSLSTTGYVGFGNPAYLFDDEVHVRVTFSLLENMTLGFEDSVLGNNDVYVVARGEGLNGYVFSLDAERAAIDLVRVDDGAIVALGDDAILYDIEGIEQDGTYTLQLSAVEDILTGQIYDESMTLLGEVSVQEDTYPDGWVGLGAAINDEGEELDRTLIAARFDDFWASDSADVDIPDIDELTAAINMGLTDPRYDIDQNGTVDADDRVAWVHDINNTYFGDANLDGQFDSGGDFVQVFVAGKYETGAAASWAEGDWDGDGFFASGDMVTAFVDGGYEQGPRENALAVPEPAGGLLWLLGLTSLIAGHRRRHAGQ